MSAAGTALAVVGAAGGVYVMVHRQLHDDVADQLRARAAIHVARGFTNVRELRPLGGRQAPEPPTLPRLIAADGRVLAARYPRLRYPITSQSRAVAAGTRSSALEKVRFEDDHLQVLTVAAGNGRALQLAQSLESVQDTLHRLLLVLIAVSSAGILAAPVVGLLVAGAALRPVRRLTRGAEDIARTGDLEYRIEARGRDELASLAASFNAMLDRLGGLVQTVERARRAQRQLVADASHELRTPLASLRANVELLALGSGNAAERDELVSDVLQQLDGLTMLVSQLIELAREELIEPERTPLALDEVVDETIRRMRQHYPELEFATDLEPTTVLGARDSISRAVSNLVDNAAKWSPKGGRVDVRLRESTLHVRDHGPGIADADLPHVFERFYRGVGARTRPGSGLGLAIVAQVVSAHGGAVRAERAPGGGALLTAHLPRMPPADS
ncbi:MAG TPA: HAMP domain-containing sensor histidine kinase [Gaiellaceae bacterium]